MSYPNGQFLYIWSGLWDLYYALNVFDEQFQVSSGDKVMIVFSSYII